MYCDQYNKGRNLCGELFQPGDLVLMKDHSALSKGTVRKFRRFQYTGPFVVTSRPYPGAYMLKWKESGKPWASPMAQVELKPFIGDEEEVINEEETTEPPGEVERVMPLGQEIPITLEEETEAPDAAVPPEHENIILPPKNILEKKEKKKTGERMYQVELENGEIEWWTEDDLPIKLVERYEHFRKEERDAKRIRKEEKDRKREDRARNRGAAGHERRSPRLQVRRIQRGVPSNPQDILERGPFRMWPSSSTVIRAILLAMTLCVMGESTPGGPNEPVKNPAESPGGGNESRSYYGYKDHTIVSEIYNCSDQSNCDPYTSM